MERTFNTSNVLRGAVSVALLTSVVMATLVLALLPAGAQQSDLLTTPQSLGAVPGEDIWAIARGGQLYDDWAAVLDGKLPEDTHPAYPAVGKKKGKITWRCKECHGWDYMGEDGTYGKGSRYTGVKGIRRMVGADPEEITRIIMDDTHRYTTDMIPISAMRKLALFVSRGQIFMDQYIDRETKKARGNLRRGAVFFQTVCAICHGFDGAQMPSKTETALAAFGDRGYMGHVASNNPWEVLHKIRNGQPGVGMIALRVLNVQDQVDVLAYMQTLIKRERGR
jgi:thiosulfate dehydrogenase